MRAVQIFFLFLFITLQGTAQLSEIGVQGGAIYYVGDLNKAHFKSNHLALGLLYRYNINKRFAFRVNFLFGNVDGNDAWSNDLNLQNRNLSFRSNITELGGMFEINYYSYQPSDKTDRFTTYLLFGFSYFRMNPEAQLEDVWYELNALKTEGQSLEAGAKKYNLNAFAIPVGLGIKFNLGKRMAIGLEYSLRFTFTDYLDDVSTAYYPADLLLIEVGDVSAELSDRRIDKTIPTSDFEGNPTGLQRGDSSHNDWYGVANIMVSFRIGSKFTTCAKWD